MCQQPCLYKFLYACGVQPVLSDYLVISDSCVYKYISRKPNPICGLSHRTHALHSEMFRSHTYSICNMAI